MLILMRRIGEAIMIGDNIVITVLDVDGSRVQLGIEAPKDVLVNREEVHLNIEREKKGLPPLRHRRPKK